ncbi:hypothetical protein EHO59_10160 [Leptospira semungkisensis]|uniref:DUF3592 domain-containing protein n=1 Tax=Leptospira semungkisensis TaxID=2484985 RepID=A0A4R9FYE9_9LEPT|nr:hypothetical protein [Leptospira semungkisensis]TGK03881.1 hypothetical protein EHO59_10160 [Leptospira semungkisensis]
MKPNSTPFYKILFVMGWVSFAFFLPLFGLVYWENRGLESIYSELSLPGNKEFGVLIEDTKLNKLGRIVHVYTYLVPDEHGKKHEVTEEVDQLTNRRMRVGDTVQVRTRTWKNLGKPMILGRIVGNTAAAPNFSFMEELFFFGIVFSLGIIALSFYFSTFKAEAE